MPLGLLTGFPAEPVEAFLIHDLAHVGRADYLVNLSQSLVEGLLVVHPWVWWIFNGRGADGGLPGAGGRSHAARGASQGSIPGGAGGDRRESVRAGPASTGSEPAQRCLRARSRGVVGRGWYGTGHRAGQNTLAATSCPGGHSNPGRTTAAARSGAAPTAMPAGTTRAYDRWLNGDVVYLIDDRERALSEACKPTLSESTLSSSSGCAAIPRPARLKTSSRKSPTAASRMPWAVWRWQTDRGRSISGSVRPTSVICFRRATEPSLSTLSDRGTAQSMGSARM